MAKKKATKKTGAKRGKRNMPVGRRFEKGNKAAVGHGRPPNSHSPREHIKRWAEKPAAQKIKNALQKAIPEVNVDELNFSEVLAIRLWMKVAEGDMSAIREIIKQVDDSGAEKVDATVGGFSEVLEDIWRRKNDDGSANNAS